MTDRINARQGYALSPRRNGARFERPAGEPSWLYGSTLLLSVLIIAAFTIGVLS